MVHAMPFTGVILAAGRSTRMGTEKALLEVGQVPLWQRQRDLLRAAGATELFLSARSDQPWAAATTGFDAVLHDAVPDCGPMMGIAAALERMSHAHLAVLAVDLPALPPEWFTHLLAQSAPGCGCVAVSNGYFEPLAAVYPREMAALVREHVTSGRYGLQQLLHRARAQGLVRSFSVPAEQSSWLANWNTPRESGRSGGRS